MKSQRRHELQQNVLDAELAKGVQFVTTHRTALGWGFVIALLAILAVFYAVRHFRQKALEVQLQYERLTLDPEMTDQERISGLRGLSEGSDKHYAALALARLGDLYARQLVGAAGMSTVQRDEMAETAAGYYRRVIDRYKDQKQALGEAHLGMGKLHESFGDLAAARAEYQSVMLMMELAGRPAVDQAQLAMRNLDSVKGPVRMATTSSAPATAPAAGRKAASQPGANAAPSTRPGQDAKTPARS